MRAFLSSGREAFLLKQDYYYNYVYGIIRDGMLVYIGRGAAQQPYRRNYYARARNSLRGHKGERYIIMADHLSLRQSEEIESNLIATFASVIALDNINGVPGIKRKPYRCNTF